MSKNIIPRRSECFRLGVYVLVYGMRCGYVFKTVDCEGCVFNKEKDNSYCYFNSCGYRSWIAGFQIS